MKAVRSVIQTVIFALSLAISAGCGPSVPVTPQTAAPTANVKVTKITENEPVFNLLTQTKTIDQCESASSLKANIQFSESSSKAEQKELVLGLGMKAGGEISGVVQVELEGSIEQHFSTTEETGKVHQENVNIEVPAHTHQVYSIVWQETRREGTIDYVENGEAKSTSYSYRVGLEWVSTTVKDIPCQKATEAAFVPATDSPTMAPTPTNLPPKPISQGCITSQMWQPIATGSLATGGFPTDANGCYELETFGVYADRNGALHFNMRGQKKAVAGGIYTPINNGSVIEFRVFVNSMYLVYKENPLILSFAVTNTDNPMPTENSARFNLRVEAVGNKPWIYFMMADIGESAGMKVSTQHYEYGRTYTIRFELEGNTMKVFINNKEMNDTLLVPTGQKVFYIGYNLPIQAGVDAEVREIKVDGQLR